MLSDIWRPTGLINDIDFICRGCFRHIPHFYIEGLIDFTKQTKDAELARRLNSVADALVSFQRCPECTMKVLRDWEKGKLKKKRKEEKKFLD